MYQIVAEIELAPNIKQFRINAPLIAKKCMPGQFIVLRTNEKGERIPLTVCDKDPGEGMITIIFQEVWKTTKELGRLRTGEAIQDVVGPLGTPSEIRNYGQVVAIAGGTAAAVAYPEIKALKLVGNKLITILGARSKDLLILEEEMRKYSDELYITTDDGSKGHHGFVTDVLKKLVADGKKIDMVLAIGPAIMMKVASEITRPFNIRTIVSVNPIMLDATGMCGVCRVRVNNEMKLGCVDGPEFDGHLVDFDQLMARQNMYTEKEKESLHAYEAKMNK